jgi:protein-tyrosine phosphatase
MHLNDPAGWPFAHSLVDYYRYHDSEAISVPAAAEVSDGLYVGNYLGALDVLRTRHLDYVISLCRTGIELDGSASSGMKHIEVWLNDTVEYRWNPNLPHLLETAAQTLNSLLSQRKTLLVHCVVGRSRSIALASYALALRENKPFDEVLLTITEQLPPVQLGPVVDAARELFAKRGEYFAV